MRPRTEDLLAVRDGEPLDALARAAVESSPFHEHEVERLRRMRNALRALPAIEPPPHVLTRVLEEKEVKVIDRSR